MSMYDSFLPMYVCRMFDNRLKSHICHPELRVAGAAKETSRNGIKRPERSKRSGRS